MTLSVHCQEVKKTYGTGLAKVEALRGITFESYTGELLMIVGPSGCGKTTLLSIISGILSQDSGSCLIFGKDINRLENDEKVRYRGQHIGFIFQSFNLIPMWTALENTMVPLLLNGEEREAAYAKARELLERIGLGKRMDAFPREMSGGEQQRVAICRGCIHKPDVIVCDEPTSALDHSTGLSVMEMFKELTAESSLIIVTHDTRIFDFADRILHIEDGRIVNEVD